MKTHHHYLKLLVLFLIGGGLYCAIEILWRGHSHISMFILGGICFVLIGFINEFLPWNMGIVWQSLIGGILVTGAEFLTGLLVNVWLGLNVWDYSDLPFNVMGQVSLLYFFLWIPLSCVAIVLDDTLRHWLFHEEEPHYTLL